MADFSKETEFVRQRIRDLEELRKKAEALLGAEDFAFDTPKGIEAQKVFHELQIHQLELEMQNDQLNEAATELEGQKLLFSSLFELAPVGYVVLNHRGSIQEINHTACRLFGLRRELLLGKSLPGFVYADDVSIFYSFFRRILAGSDEQNCQIRMFKLHQDVFYAELNGVSAGKGGPKNIYITISDITEKKRYEMDLARAKQRLDVALTASSTGIWEISLPSGKIYLDDFSHSIFGLYPGTFDGRYASLMEHVDDADREAVDTALRVAMVRETDFSIEFGIHTSKGEKKYLNARGQVIYDADVTKRFTGTITDITEKKQLELETEQLKENQQQEIRAASLQAEENAKRSISESLHDSVGQILYAMRINLEQLKEQQGNPHYKQASRLLDQAVREVRDLSFELAPSILKDFGLMATLQEMSRRLSNDSLAVKVSGSDVSHLEMPMMVNIYRIVQELVNNSIKHGGASQVNIHISNKKDTIDIRVKDNGKGFSVNKVAQSPSGTGLSSIRNRINLYHGSMNIESAPGKGTNVFIQLKQ